jgi:hypothetical protein
MPGSVAVIGASGSVGSIVVKYLAEGLPIGRRGQTHIKSLPKAATIIAVDIDFKAPLPAGVEQVIANAADEGLMREKLAEVEYVVFCAAPAQKGAKTSDDVFVNIPCICASLPNVKRCVMLSSSLVTEKHRKAPPRILLNNGILLPGGGKGYLDALMKGENVFRKVLSGASKEWFVVRPGMLKHGEPDFKISVAKGDIGTVPGGDAKQSCTRAHVAAMLVYCVSCDAKNKTFEIGDVQPQRVGCCGRSKQRRDSTDLGSSGQMSDDFFGQLLSGLEEDDLQENCEK